MCQKEVYKFLENNPDQWFTSREIADATGINIAKVWKNCSVMVKYKEIISKEYLARKYKWKYQKKAK